MANIEFGCIHGHSADLRYRKPDNHLSCRGCERARQARYYLNHADQVRVRSRACYQAHLEARRLYGRTYVAKYGHIKIAQHAELRHRVLETLGLVCACCGFGDTRALQVDHIFGGGSQESRTGHRKMYAKILLNSTGYQLLCANCNAIKKAENHEVPQTRLPHLSGAERRLPSLP